MELITELDLARWRSKNPAVVAGLMAAEGFRVLPLHGIRPSFRPDAGAAICTCAEGGHRPSCRVDLPGRHPRHPRGWAQVATTDSEVIDDWCARFTHLNFAALTGERLVTLTVIGAEGSATLDLAQRRLGRLPATPISRDAADPATFVIWLEIAPNRPAPLSGVIGQGVTVQGRDAWTLIPGGHDISGRRAAWVTSPAETPIARLPGAWAYALSVAADGAGGSAFARPASGSSAGSPRRSNVDKCRCKETACKE